MPMIEQQQQEMETRRDNAKRLNDAMTGSRIGTEPFRVAFKQEATRLQTLVTDISDLQSALNKNNEVTADERANIQKYIDNTNKRIDAMLDLLNATVESVTKYKKHLKAGAMESVFAVNAMLNGIIMESKNADAKEYFDQSLNHAHTAKQLDITAVKNGKEEISSGFRQAIRFMMDVLVAIPVFCIALALTTMCIPFGMFMPELVVGPIAGAIAIVDHVDDLMKEAASETEHLDVLKDAASLKTIDLVEPKDTEKNDAQGQSAVSPSINSNPQSELKGKIQALKNPTVLEISKPQKKM